MWDLISEITPEKKQDVHIRKKKGYTRENAAQVGYNCSMPVQTPFCVCLDFTKSNEQDIQGKTPIYIYIYIYVCMYIYVYVYIYTY